MQPDHFHSPFIKYLCLPLVNIKVYNDYSYILSFWWYHKHINNDMNLIYVLLLNIQILVLKKVKDQSHKQSPLKKVSLLKQSKCNILRNSLRNYPPEHYPGHFSIFFRWWNIKYVEHSSKTMMNGIRNINVQNKNLRRYLDIALTAQ